MIAVLAALLCLQPGIVPALTAECHGGAVVKVADIPYRVDDGVDTRKHGLDLYLPPDRPAADRAAKPATAGAPVLFFVHGGGWSHGDRRMNFDIYGPWARSFAAEGYLVVVPSYRLSPQVQHPEHIRDVAAAFAWVVKSIAWHGGDPRRIVLCGHSAGGHLVSLLATDPRWAQEWGVSLEGVRGVLPLSGIFDIPRFAKLFHEVFGRDPDNHRSAAPLLQVRPGVPPFLVLVAEFDFLCFHQDAAQFTAALRANGGTAEYRVIPKREHFGIFLRSIRPADPTRQAMLAFFASRVGRAQEPAANRP